MKVSQNVEVDTSWKSFYRFAGIAALLIVLAGILDTALSMSAGDARPNGAIDVTEWFALFETHRLTALSNLGLINFITLTLGIPVYLALYQVHRRFAPAFALFSAVMFFMGAAIYMSSNTLFSMLALSTQYAVAGETQKPLLEAAGRAALAQGADLTPGTFIGLIFTQVAGLIMTIVMLRAGIFSRVTAWIGLFGYSCMIVFFSMTAFRPDAFDAAMLISMFGGLALMAYHILFARRLFHFSK